MLIGGSSGNTTVATVISSDYSDDTPTNTVVGSNGGSSSTGARGCSTSVCQTVGDAASILALTADVSALGLSAAGALIELVLGLAGEAVSPVPGADGLTGFALGVEIYRLAINPVENILGWVSFGGVAVNEGINGELYIHTIDDGGTSAIELVIGPDTAFYFFSSAVGQYLPEAGSDTFLNSFVVYYDIQRMGDEEPFWGLTEGAIGITEDGVLYITVTGSGPLSGEIRIERYPDGTVYITRDYDNEEE